MQGFGWNVNNEVHLAEQIFFVVCCLNVRLYYHNNEIIIQLKFTKSIDLVEQV